MTITIIVGANRGIGLELAKQHADRGETVVATCRTNSPELSALSVEVVEGVDVGNSDTLRALRDVLGSRKVNRLVINAGILRTSKLGSLNFDSIRKQLDINSMGPLRVVEAMGDSLESGSKIGILTSRMGSMADNTSGGAYGYRMSKAAVNAAGVSLAQDLKPKGIAVVLLHPGYVRTEMTGGNGLIDADESAKGLIAQMDELTLESTGSFKHMNGEDLPW